MNSSPGAPIRFEIVSRDARTSARTAVLHTPHGDIDTPAFAPVGTRGAVKAISPRDLEDLGVQLVMVNAFHLAMRPGTEPVRRLGTVHDLGGWHGPLMSDSGGYQAFSLGELADQDEDGITFRYPVDGSVHRFTPETVTRLQEELGADLVMPLDVCTPYPATVEQATTDMRLTHAWAERARRCKQRQDQLLYGIVQGSVYPDLRQESAIAISELGFDAFAIGGVSVGESKDEMYRAVLTSVEVLPEGRPRHLLGVGHPEDLVATVAHGIDTFDCVMPTRVARNGGALTMSGRMNLRNAVHRTDPSPIDPECRCYACTNFSRSAIRHFVTSDEILGIHLLTLHNLHFVLDLMRRIRHEVADGTYAEFAAHFAESYVP